MATSEINFENYSNEELYDIYNHINKDKYPERFIKLMVEMHNRNIDIENDTIGKIINDDHLPKPDLYSRQMVYTFSALFSVVVGVILFIRNLHEIGKKKYTFPVCMGLLAYFAIGVLILSLWTQYILAPFYFNVIGALIINYLLWDELIGDDLKYNKKSFVKPLIICMIISVIPIITFLKSVFQ
jgi:hypothetical protein